MLERHFTSPLCAKGCGSHEEAGSGTAVKVISIGIELKLEMVQHEITNLMITIKAGTLI